VTDRTVFGITVCHCWSGSMGSETIGLGSMAARQLAPILDDFAQPVLMQTTIGGAIEGLVIDILLVAYMITPNAQAFFVPSKRSPLRFPS